MNGQTQSPQQPKLLQRHFKANLTRFKTVHVDGSRVLNTKDGNEKGGTPSGNVHVTSHVHVHVKAGCVFDSREIARI